LADYSSERFYSFIDDHLDLVFFNVNTRWCYLHWMLGKGQYNE